MLNDPLAASSCLLYKRDFVLVKRDQENSRDIQPIAAWKEAK